MTGSHTLFDTIRRIVRQEVRRIRTAELAVVEEQHPHADDSDKDNYACTVALRDSGIVLKKVPVATQRIGTASIPAVGDLVLVQFIGGDINAPVITGRLYNDEDRPPVNGDGQGILHLPPGAGDSDAVHAELHSGDSREFNLKLGNGLELNLKDDDPVVEIKVDGGKGVVAIARDGAITIESRGDLNMTGGGSINIEASGELNLKGSVINLN
ncbi:MAG: Rhs element Vgr protein [Desulfobacteraceae bacterium]|nr:Rhs element Vgr protein [Desulfobacteraceae bacterium]